MRGSLAAVKRSLLAVSKRALGCAGQQHVRSARRWLGGALSLSVATLPAGCALVGYGEQTDPAVTSEAGAATAATGGAQDAGPTRDEGAADAAQPPLDASAAAQSGRDAANDAMSDNALADAAPRVRLDGGWWNGREPDLTCDDGHSCYPVCEQDAGRCVFDCAGASLCEATCATGTACAVGCGDTERCEMACKVDAQCWFGCEDSGRCSAWCTTGARCLVDCTGADSCALMCLDGSSCEVDCSGDVDCSGYSCSVQASCLLYCGDHGCDMDCQGVGASCADDIQVCNRPCP